MSDTAGTKGPLTAAATPVAPLPVSTPSMRPSRRLVAGLSLGVLALAIAGYSVTGSPSLARGGAAVAAAQYPQAQGTPA